MLCVVGFDSLTGATFSIHTTAVALALRDFRHSTLFNLPFETYGQHIAVMCVFHALHFTIATLNIIISIIISFCFPFATIIYPPTNPNSNQKTHKTMTQQRVHAFTHYCVNYRSALRMSNIIKASPILSYSLLVYYVYICITL